MEFSDWKQSMESEATLENKELKEKLAKLEQENAELKRKYQAKQLSKNKAIDDCKALSERCFVLTSGLFCANCQLKEYQCKHKKSIERELMQIAREEVNKRREELKKNYQ